MSVKSYVDSQVIHFSDNITVISYWDCFTGFALPLEDIPGSHQEIKKKQHCWQDRRKGLLQGN
jgi:hypothetical protein